MSAVQCTVPVCSLATICVGLLLAGVVFEGGAVSLICHLFSIVLFELNNNIYRPPVGSKVDSL